MFKRQGILPYDINQISNEDRKREAAVLVSKVGTVQIMIEALQLSSSTYRSNLEGLLKETPEALVDSDAETDGKII